MISMPYHGHRVHDASGASGVGAGSRKLVASLRAWRPGDVRWLRASSRVLPCGRWLFVLSPSRVPLCGAWSAHRGCRRLALRGAAVRRVATRFAACGVVLLVSGGDQPLLLREVGVDEAPSRAFLFGAGTGACHPAVLWACSCGSVSCGSFVSRASVRGLDGGELVVGLGGAGVERVARAVAVPVGARRGGTWCS